MTHLRPLAYDAPAVDGLPVSTYRASPSDRASRVERPVTHGYAAVTFCTGGRSRVEQHGEWQLGAGDVLVVPAGEPHRLLEAKHLEYWGLAVRTPCFAADATLLDPFEKVRDGAAAVVHIPSARHGFLEQLFRELHDVGGAASEAVQRSLLTLIVAEIDRAHRSSQGATLAASRGGVVVESLRFIERNCLRRLTASDVAAAVGRSPTYVTTALTQATGRSAGEWIALGRMAEARRRLLHSDERVDVIAERVGYADVTHFIRMFRRKHGATPAAWRAARQAAR